MDKAATFQNKRNNRKIIERWVSSVKNALGMVSANKMFYDMCGFTYRRSNATITANAPQNLVAIGEFNDINKLKFFGNNNQGVCSYQIWRGRAVPGNGI